jgi:hypothetical protein
MLLGLIIFLIGFLSAGLPAAFHSASADQFPYLSPLARVGRGLLALGALLLLPVLFILRRRTVRIRSQGRIYVQQRYRHPRLAAIAGLWAYVVGVAIFAVLALAPRELLVGWLAQAGSVLDGFDASGLIFMGALWAGVLFASAPTLALRLFDRPR